MTTAYTSLLGLALPVTGELSGTWGNTVNTEITALLDSAIAGTTTISADADVTLTTTTGAANTSRQVILLWTAGGTATRNITAPAQSKTYIVINKSSSTQSIVLRGVGPTTGVTIIKGEAAVCAWNGTDFIKVANISGAGVFTSITNSGLTSGRVVFSTTGGLETDSANMTFDGTTLTAAGFSGPLNGTVGATTASTGSFTSLAYSTTLTGGTGIVNLGSGQFYKDASGNVGIGTTAGTTTVSSGLAINNATATNYPGLEIQTAGVTRMFLNANNAESYISSVGTNPLVTSTNGSERMRIDNSGNVGIGTTTMTGKLNVTGAAAGIAGYFSDSTNSSLSIATLSGGVTLGTDAGGAIHLATDGATAAKRRLTIDSSGNVGIGNTAANVNDQVGAVRPLLVSKSDSATTIAGSQAAIVIGNSDTTTSNTSQLSFAAITGASTTYFTSAAINCIFGARTNAQYPTGQLTFSTSTTLNVAPTEKMRIDNSGNVGIGTSSPSSYGLLSVVSSTAGSAKISIQDTSGGASPAPLLQFGVNSSNGFNTSDAARVWATSPSSSTAALNFAAYSGGAPSTAQMTLTGGNVLIGTTSLSAVGSRISVKGSSEVWGCGPTSGNDSFFVYNASSVGVYLGNGGTSWSSSSDERIKTTITPFENALDKICTLRAGTGRYLTDAESVRRSFLIAQDVQKILPEAINVQDDEIGTLGLQYTDVIPLLVAAIKEQQALITSLTARVAALEST